MLTDRTFLKIEAGKGGNGAIGFERNRKPDGGHGGDGGSVYFVGSHNVFDFSKFDKTKTYRGEAAVHGGKNKLTGRNGEDLELKVPLVTEIYDEAGDHLGTISKPGQKILIAKGGQGGLGNHFFRAGQVETLYKTTSGKPGEELRVELKLKLVADIVFIGLPNAGKSSIINELSNASSKVAAYPFTTLDPHLGLLNNVIMLDLPGLIEGTSVGKGLGPRFMQHTEYSKMVAHFISLESDDLLRDYNVIRKEILAIEPKLKDTQEMIILTKSDLFEQEEVDKKLKELDSIDLEKLVVNVFDNDLLKVLKTKFIAYSEK